MRTIKKGSLLDESFFRGICHRGLHNQEFTENGLKAFQNAIDHGMAFELDIHLTKDNVLLVCHDEELVRTTGKKGIIEDLTAAEIRENYRLLDGEVVPTFQEVLDLNQERSLIVVELKTFRKNYFQLGKAARKFLDERIKNPKKIAIISFDPRALMAFRKGPYHRALLICKEKEFAWGWRWCSESLDLEWFMAKEPRVISYRKKGKGVNVWTVQTEEQLKEIAPYVDTVTFEYLDPELVTKTLEENG